VQNAVIWFKKNLKRGRKPKNRVWRQKARTFVRNAKREKNLGTHRSLAKKKNGKERRKKVKNHRATSKNSLCLGLYRRRIQQKRTGNFDEG